MPRLNIPLSPRPEQTYLDLASLLDWLSFVVLPRAPGEILDWLLGKTPDPPWLSLADDLDLGVDEWREWRAKVIEASSEAGSLDIFEVHRDSESLTVFSTPIGGRWSGWSFREGSGHLRLEPGRIGGVNAWLIKEGSKRYTLTAEDGETRLSVTDENVPDTEGALVISKPDSRKSRDTLHLKATDMPLDEGAVLKLLEAHLRITPAGDASVDFRYKTNRALWNLLRLFWPFVRPFFSRRIKVQLEARIDQLLSASSWPAVVEAARQETS